VDHHVVAAIAGSETNLRRAGQSAAADDGSTPATVTRIVVPVDGSPFAERPLPVAAWLAPAIGAPLHLVEVVGPDDDVERASRYLDALARRYGAASWDACPGDDPAAAIVAATDVDGHGLACLATQGRDRSAAVLGSVAAAVLNRASDPVLLVGRKARPSYAGDAPVVVAVDGSWQDTVLVGVASDWASRLGRRLVVATVAEPVPGSFREDRPLHRARGPDDPEGYAASLAADVARLGTLVDTQVVYDPISVRGGLVGFVDRMAALLVTGSHRRGPRCGLVGSHAARIVHDVEVPALVVPLGGRR
jgi:nucleotide-binding universal stress UspA family protein